MKNIYGDITQPPTAIYKRGILSWSGQTTKDHTMTIEYYFVACIQHITSVTNPVSVTRCATAFCWRRDKQHISIQACRACCVCTPVSGRLCHPQ